jgi:hypothetical protein
MSHTCRTYAALLAVAVAIGLIAVVLMPAPPAHAMQGFTAAETATVHAAVGKGADYTPEQGQVIVDAAYAVCEAQADRVPAGTVTAYLRDSSGLTVEEAVAVENAAWSVLC